MHSLKGWSLALLLAGVVLSIGVSHAQEADTPDVKTPFAQLHIVPPPCAPLFPHLHIVGKQYRLVGGEGWIRTPRNL